MKYYRFLLLLPLLGMAKKCEREPVPTLPLPAITESGANALGFVVDGRVWRNYGWLPYTTGESDNLRSSYYPRSSKSFNLNAGQIGGDVYELFSLTIDSLARTGTYQASLVPLPGANSRAERGISFINQSTNATYISHLPNSQASITITKLDTTQHIIAGTFSATLRQQQDTTKRVRITDGRFDVRYQ